jgi:predicted acetyltransferase
MKNMIDDVHFKKISPIDAKWGQQISIFLNGLNIEKIFFNLTTDRILKSELIIAAIIDDEIAGIGSLENKYRVIRATIMFKSKFQGKGLGKKMVNKIHESAHGIYNLLMAVIDQENIPSLNLFKSMEYQVIGKRENLYYLFCPLSTNGRIMLALFKIIFPLVSMLDKIRH